MAEGVAHSPAMPVELWRHVASFLTLRDSCMLASTCRALWAMDLLSVSVTLMDRYASDEDDEFDEDCCCLAAKLMWASKRWSHARVLMVDIMEENVKELSQVLACSTTSDLASLEELQVQVLHYGDDDVPFSAACSQLLTQARNVQVLYAQLESLSGFVCARGIKHLMLVTPNPHCGDLSAAMSGLEQLETLWLQDGAGIRVQPQTYGALQLLDFQKLRSLRLIGVVPESISCSDSCELHVGLAVGWSMEHPVWDTVLSLVRSVSLCGWRTPLVALPRFLLKAGNVTSVFVRVDQCGTAGAPLLLGGSLAHVEELVLRCLEVHAIVPARVTWRVVYVAATHLNLRFEDVAAFGEAIPAFCFRFKELQGCALFELAAVVAKRLPEWTGSFCDDEDACYGRPVTGGMCFPLTQPPCMLYDALERCRCGACAGCLRAAGIMH